MEINNQKKSDYRLLSVSFFCPAYNDQDNLPLLIPKVYDLLQQISDKFEIIIVEDGSPDKTGEVADRLAREFPYVHVIHHPKNLGYGATLRDGFLSAQYDYVMYTDGDNQYDVYEFLPYLHLLQETDVISGYAIKKAVTFLRKIQSFIYNFLIKILFFVNIRDINCSMKIYKRKVIEGMNIKSNSSFIDAEMIIKAKRAGFKIKQFPITHYERKSGLASGSKMSVILNTIKDILKFRLSLL